MFDWKSIVKPNGKPFCALTAGLAIFLTFIFLLEQIFSIEGKMELSPEHIFSLPRLCNYPLVHLSSLHLIFNLISLTGPLNLFESQHGTVYTGVTLNLTAIFAGLLYCIFGKLLYPDQAVAGASGWFFTFVGYFSWKASLATPRTQFLQTPYHFPTALSPLLLLLLITILIPNASFWGHLCGLAVGYIMGSNEKAFSKLSPPSWLIKKIEDKLDVYIEKIPIVKYYREAEVEDTDRTDYSWLFEPNVSLPLHNDPPTQQTRGSGRVLGTA